MASYSVFRTIPTSQNPLIPSKIPHSLSKSSPLSINHSFQKLGLTTDSIIVRSSHQAEALIDSDTQDRIDVPVLTCSQAIERLRSNREKNKGKQRYLAMYSSIFGGIITDPAAMVIPMDDHMVHRGHGVFDTAAIMDGFVYFASKLRGYLLYLLAYLIFDALILAYFCISDTYELDQHLDRSLRSASMAKINLPFDREGIRRILIQAVSVSNCQKGSLRYWLSAGPGDFQLSPSGCHQPALYAIVIQDQYPLDSKGVKVVTSSVPIKPPQFATMKSVNYLPNVLSKMEAEESGAFVAIWLDNDGFIAEGPNMNVAFVTQEKNLLMPSFDKILSGCTAKRVLTLAEELVREGKLHDVKIGDVTVEEGKNADEMMLIGSGILVRPVVQWDEQIIGDGKEGPITEGLLNLILEDMKSGPPSVRTPVP